MPILACVFPRGWPADWRNLPYPLFRIRYDPLDFDQLAATSSEGGQEFPNISYILRLPFLLIYLYRSQAFNAMYLTSEATVAPIMPKLTEILRDSQCKLLVIVIKPRENRISN